MADEEKLRTGPCGRPIYELFVYSTGANEEGFWTLGGKLRRYHGDPDTQSVYVEIIGSPPEWRKRKPRRKAVLNG